MNQTIRLYFLLKFLCNAKTIYKAHSPFLYELILNCFNLKNPIKIPQKVEIIRGQLRSANKKIAITDFGTGINRQKKIKQIAKTSVTSEKRSLIIHQLIKYFNSNTIIELGTNLGLNTVYMALPNSNATIHSIEGCPNLFKIAHENISQCNLTNVKLINETFEQSLPKLLSSLGKFDFIYMDGNHSYEATMEYFKHCLKHKHNDSIILVDDIHWSKEMNKAWKEICSHKDVTLTINYYYSGLVFFKKELSKENFTLRYKNFFKTR